MLVYISTYHVVIRAIIVTVGFVITHLSTHCLPSILVFIHHIYLFTISYSPLKSHTKNLQPFIGTDYLVLFALILLLASHHRSSSTILLLIFFPPTLLVCYLVSAEKKEKKREIKKKELKKVKKKKLKGVILWIV